MKRAALLVLLTVGCGGSAKTTGTSVSPPVDMSVADEPFDFGLPATTDFFVGRYSCLQTVAEYCALAGNCINQMADAVNPDAGCFGLGASVETCGGYDEVVRYYGGPDAGVTQLESIDVYDLASGQLVAILTGGSGANSLCIAGPSVFVDPALLDCADDGGAPAPPVQICAPVALPPCGAPLDHSGVRPAKCT